MLQTLPRAFTRHLDESERRHRHYLVARVIASHRLLEYLQNVVAVLLFFHIDEVDDDNAAEIAQAKLPRDRHGRLEIGSVDGLLEIPMADVATGVNVHSRHRFRLVKN